MGCTVFTPKSQEQLSDARSVKRSGSRINNLYTLPACRPATEMRDNPKSEEEPQYGNDEGGFDTGIRYYLRMDHTIYAIDKFPDD
jgi:hypothetical protein